MTPMQRLDVQPWMVTRATRSLLAALRAGGGEVRFVGGCVRNAVLAVPVEDIDLATSLLPEEVVRALTAAGLASVPTGLAHGTVTAIVDGQSYEITTLRRDVETDGRHAVVAFTRDWQADAARRDFTLNALYADEEGHLFDYVGGLNDLQARHVRFVGEPARRLAEDYLRALRFYRFSAWYGTPPYDAAGRAACAAAARSLDRLSGERVRRELLALLAAPSPITAMDDMLADGVLRYWLPEATGTTRDLGHLVEIERSIAAADRLRRLAALIADRTDVGACADRLRLSRAEADRLGAMLAEACDGDIDGGPRGWRRAIHRVGRAAFVDRLLLVAARRGLGWEKAYELATTWRDPKFPVRGADVLARGVPAGSAVGEILTAVEDWWVDGDFTADRAACLDRLAQEVRRRKLAC